MSTTQDPKFVPSNEALAVVGLSQNKVKSDKAIFDLLTHADEMIDTLESQYSVGIYILKQRGWTNAKIAQRTNYAERTVVRKYIEGMAVLRTGETVRTIAAVRAADLTEKTVQECTKGTGDSESKIQMLERAALAKEVQGKFVTNDGKCPDKAVIDKVIDATAAVVAAQSEPATAGTFIDAIPQISEELGLRAKQRTTDPDGGKAAPQTVAFHLKAALADAKKIADAADEDYLPSPADIKALLTLCTYLGLELMIEPEVAAVVGDMA
jgi:hypothetical protein